MEQEFLIFEYLDGEMNPAQEEAFFNLLSQNEELRSEFKQQIALKNAFVKDLKGFAPNPQSTMNIFAKLGISAAAITAASNTVTSSASTSFFTTLTNFFTGTAAKSVISTLLVSLVTFATLLKLEVIEWYDEEGGSKVTVSNILTKQNDNTINNQLSNLSNNNPIKNEAPQTIEKVVYKNNFIFTIDTLKLKGKEKEKAIALLDKLENLQNNVLLASNQKLNLSDINDLVVINNSSIIENRSNLNNNPNMNTIPSQKVFVGSFSQISNGLDLPVSIEILAQAYNSLAQNEIDVNRNYSQINNGKFNLLYNVNSEFYLGGNFTNESYYQNFNYIDKNGRNFEYFQKPEFNVASALLRYSPDYLKVNTQYINIEPMTQASYGYDLNGGGNVTRFGAGANIYLTDKLYFQLLGEYSNLTYSQDNQKYNSNKFVGSIGIGVNLGK